MMKQFILVFLSVVAVAIGSVLAAVTWSTISFFDPLWRASFSVVAWMVGFAAGTRLFWVAAKRMSEVPTTA
jgi:hypothetical protein